MENGQIIIDSITWIINALVSALAFVLWHKFKAVEDKAEKTKVELADFKTHVAERYSQKKDIEEMERRLNEQLSNLSQRVEQGFQMIYQQLLKGKD